MKLIQFTRQERAMQHWLKFLAFGFLVVGIIFALYPDQTLQYIDDLGHTFLSLESPPITEQGFGLWWVLAVAMTLGLSLVCFRAQSDWLRRANLVPVIIIMKGFATIAFFVGYFVAQPHFYMLVGGVVAGVIALFTGLYYVKAIQTRSEI